MRKILVTIFFVGALIVSVWFGAYISSKKIANSVEGLQAELAFAHLVTYRKIHNDVAQGCNKQALDRLSHAIDEQKMLMAEFVQAVNDSSFNEYVTIRDPDLIGELSVYEVDWNKSWEIPICNNTN